MSNVGPHALQSAPAVMTPTGHVDVREASPTFFPDLDRDYNQFKGHTLMMTFAFEADWPTWEIHPNGDEFIYLLEGDTDLVLWVNGAEQVVRVNEPGSYIVVPKNTWHTARPHTFTRMLFVTPGEATRNAPQPDEVSE